MKLKLPAWMTPWRKATDQNAVTPIRDLLRQPTKGGFIVEAFGGAWQANLVVESQENLMRVAAVYACISLRARDIAKLRVMLMKRADDGVWDEVTEASPFLAVLRKPNRFQTRIQFINYWIVSKLMAGNTYIWKERDQRGIVRAMYPLDPYGCQPLVAPDGGVYYKLHAARLVGLQQDVIVPASEIIHDRCITPWHPLVGVSPLYACGPTATQAIRMQNYSEVFFKNMSRPSGQLTAPGTIDDQTAARVKGEFEKGFSQGNIGRLFVSGDGLKFEGFTMPAEDSQLIEQLGWTVEDVARAFGVPLYKIQAGEIPSASNVGVLNQQYLDQVLLEDIVAIEALLDEGLELPGGLRTNLDEDDLMRLDPLGRAEVYDKQVKAGVLAPNEARRKEGRHGVTGGDTPYLQQQNYSLEALAKRDASPDPFAPDGGVKPEGTGEKSFDGLKQKFDAYGVAVRAGAITPQISDEENFRQDMDLPPISDEAKEAWEEDGGFRRPITLKGGEGGGPIPPAQPPAGEEDEEDKAIADLIARSAPSVLRPILTGVRPS